LAEHKLRGCAARQAVAIGWHAGVTRLRVTALAQHWTAHGEHAGLVGTMWVMAIAAILGDQCMFPKVRSAFLGMTIKTGVVERLLCELQIIGCAMRVMAATAIHFALAYRMRIRFQ
jgi:hypothetical protein